MKIAIFIFLLLASCGYQHLDDQKIIKTVFVKNEYKDNSYFKKIIIKEFFNRFKSSKENSLYILDIKNIAESDSPINLDRDGNISEYRYQLSLKLALIQNDQEILTKKFSESINYRINSGYYASQIAKDSSRIELTNKIIDDFINSFYLNIKK